MIANIQDVLTDRLIRGYASRALEKDSAGISLLREAANSRNRNDAAFLSPKVCPVSAGRAGAAAMRAGASPVRLTPVSVCPLISLEVGGYNPQLEATK